jgi:hypothetical protein
MWLIVLMTCSGSGVELVDVVLLVDVVFVVELFLVLNCFVVQIATSTKFFVVK